MVSQVLELAKFIDQDRMTDVKIWRRRIKARLHP